MDFSKAEFTCIKCGKQCRDKYDFEKHKSRKFSCDKNENALTQKHKCEKCSKVFVRSDVLKKHTIICKGNADLSKFIISNIDDIKALSIADENKSLEIKSLREENAILKQQLNLAQEKIKRYEDKSHFNPIPNIPANLEIGEGLFNIYFRPDTTYIESGFVNFCNKYQSFTYLEMYRWIWRNQKQIKNYCIFLDAVRYEIFRVFTRKEFECVCSDYALPIITEIVKCLFIINVKANDGKLYTKASDIISEISTIYFGKDNQEYLKKSVLPIFKDEALYEY